MQHVSGSSGVVGGAVLVATVGSGWGLMGSLVQVAEAAAGMAFTLGSNGCGAPCDMRQVSQDKLGEGKNDLKEPKQGVEW